MIESKENPKAREYFIQQNYNCAETVLLICSEQYGLDLTKDEVRLLSGFGGGMNCGKVCGAVAGAVAVFSRILVKDRAHDTENFHDLTGGLVAELEQALGSTECHDLMPIYRTPELRCVRTVEITLEVLDQYLKKNGIIAA